MNSLNSVLKISNDNHDIYRLHKILIVNFLDAKCTAELTRQAIGKNSLPFLEFTFHLRN